jgi:hypothetical protein
MKKTLADFKKVNPVDKIRELERELKLAQAESADATVIKAIIGTMAAKTATATVPTWVHKIRASSSPGTPLLFLSDLHWGEVVHPTQLNGVNEYNLQIANRRLRSVVESAASLSRIISPKRDYPGIVVALGGDMISGDIHEELVETNDMPTIPTVLNLFKALAAAIGLLADEFGKVVLPCVTGNHGRNTKKIRNKNRHHTSFDWMLYQMLAEEFKEDPRVSFLIPDGPDALFALFATRYCLTHGDQFRGGDGMIGPLGPITRGDHKKRSRNMAVNLAYDILMMGHWHTYMMLSYLLVNGSLKGYDEYANSNNFRFEVPQQSFHLTHPKHGPTFRMPIYAESKSAAKMEWVSVPGI